jgi:hypothetical protein
VHHLRRMTHSERHRLGRRSARDWLFLAPLLAAAGCWDGTPTDETPEESVSDSLEPMFPLQEGNRWTYRVTHRDGVSTKVNEVGALEEVGGTGPRADHRAFKVSTTRDDMLQTVTWREEVGESVVRYRELSLGPAGDVITEKHWMPHKVHIDGTMERREVGATWIESYEETRIEGGVTTTETVEDTWFIDAIDAPVTVPAGTFHAIIYQRSDVRTLKTYWYVPGIGKIKEAGGQTEELVSFDVAGP